MDLSHKLEVHMKVQVSVLKCIPFMKNCIPFVVCEVHTNLMLFLSYDVFLRLADSFLVLEFM